MINRNSIVNVIKPGPVAIGRIDISAREKLMLYQLHDLNPVCTVAELGLHVDVPQSGIIPTLRLLAAHGYIVQRQNIMDIYDKPQDIAIPTKTKEVPYREECLQMAEELAPAIGAAYHIGNYNKFALCYALLQLVNKFHVDVEKLRRACRWMAEHVNDPGFPVLHQPYMVTSKWGHICKYKKIWDERQNKSRIII
jgi:hypothetical protein